MAQKPDIQYITQFYSYGSEAKVLELRPSTKKKKFTLPTAAPDRTIRVMVDPVAWTGIAVAVLMVVLMAVSAYHYLQACREYEMVNSYVINQQDDCVKRQMEYQKLYDLDDVWEKALALGMIPMEEAEVIAIAPVIPEPEPEAPWWENISWFMRGLFA